MEGLVPSANHHPSPWEPGGMRRSGSNYKLHSSFLYRKGSLFLNCMKRSPKAICFPCFPYHCVSGFCACVSDAAGVLRVFRSGPFPSATFIFSRSCYSTQYNSPVFVLRWNPHVAVFIEALHVFPSCSPPRTPTEAALPVLKELTRTRCRATFLLGLTLLPFQKADFRQLCLCPYFVCATICVHIFS